MDSDPVYPGRLAETEGKPAVLFSLSEAHSGSIPEFPDPLEFAGLGAQFLATPLVQDPTVVVEGFSHSGFDADGPLEVFVGTRPVLFLRPGTGEITERDFLTESPCGR